MSEDKNKRPPKELDHFKSKLAPDSDKSKKESARGCWTTVWVLLLGFIAVILIVCGGNDFL
ncbi:MAG: hypothetical protein L3J51_09480 [Cocleimonas sp.]|nr:hypothetical protein [Cocleimonas sp.]